MGETHETVPLGDLIAGAFDEAACQSADPKVVSRLATHAVWCYLERQKRVLNMSSRAPRVETRHPWD